jgi:hypothetical protein
MLLFTICFVATTNLLPLLCVACVSVCGGCFFLGGDTATHSIRFSPLTGGQPRHRARLPQRPDGAPSHGRWSHSDAA